MSDRNILKENSSYINDSWKKPLLSLVTARRDCAEESLAGMCHMRTSPFVGEAPQHLYTVLKFQVFLLNTYNHMVSSNYFYSIITIDLHTVIWLQLTNNTS